MASWPQKELRIASLGAGAALLSNQSTAAASGMRIALPMLKLGNSPRAIAFLTDCTEICRVSATSLAESDGGSFFVAPIRI